MKNIIHLGKADGKGLDDVMLFKFEIAVAPQMLNVFFFTRNQVVHAGHFVALG